MLIYDPYAPAEYIAIPDPRFRACLMQEIPEAFNPHEKLNINHISVKRMAHLNIEKQGIKSLDGIEAFSALKGLYCAENQLTRIDLTDNATVRSIWCSANRLTHLTFCKSAYLESLNCSKNRLTRLELGENTNLKLLFCQQNQLSYLDLTGCASIWQLKVHTGEPIIEHLRYNPIERLKVNERFKQHDQVIEAKERQGRAIRISTHYADGTVICPDYNPISGRCGKWPRPVRKRPRRSPY